MRLFAFVTVFGALFRLVLDYSFYTSFDLYARIAGKGNADNAPASDQIPW